MSGYGYYDEEGEGLLTGAGARAKKRFVATRAISARTGRLYPKRVGYTLEYSSKIIYNQNLAKNNKWLKFANENAEVKAAREKMAAAMRNAAKAWREKMAKAHEAGQISDAEYNKMKARWERAKKIGNAKEYRAHIARARIKNFTDRFPTPEDTVSFFNNPVNRKIAPIGRNAKIIFLRVAYGLSKEDAEKFFPKYMKTPKPVRFVYPTEGAEMFAIPEYKPKAQVVAEQPKTNTTTTETEVLEEVPTEEKPKKKKKQI
jgi:hypothetical protein